MLLRKIRHHAIDAHIFVIELFSPHLHLLCSFLKLSKVSFCDYTCVISCMNNARNRRRRNDVTYSTDKARTHSIHPPNHLSSIVYICFLDNSSISIHVLLEYMTIFSFSCEVDVTRSKKSTVLERRFRKTKF